MQYHIQTVDPKFLDLRQFPQPPSRLISAAHNEALAALGSDDSVVADEVDLGVGNESVCDRPQRSRGSSADQLEILGSFELITNTISSAKEANRQTLVEGYDIPAYTPVTPETLSNRVQNQTHAAPWNHLHAFELPGTQRNQRYLPGLGTKPIRSAIDTPHTLPGDRIVPDGRSTSIDDGTWQVSYPAFGSVDISAIPFAQQTSPTDNPTALADEFNSAVSPRSGTQAWPSSSPPDSGVVLNCDDSIRESRRADVVEPYGFTAPALEQNSAEIIEQETTICQPKRVPLQTSSRQGQEIDDQLQDRRRASDNTGYETLDHDMEGNSQYRLDCLLTNRDNIRVRKFQRTTEPSLGLDEEINTEAKSIEGTCERFHSDIASSFPPTVGCFPQYWPNKQNVKGAKPTSGSFPLRPVMRSRSNRKVSITTEPQLSVIHEYGKGAFVPSTHVSRKGRRAGPLSKAKATQAAIIRKNKSVCIRCKMMKQSCSGEVPCLGCRENLGAKIWKSPCVKADFLDIVEAGSCNYISQRRINHFTLDKSRRVSMLLPETFNLTELLDLLKPRLSRFNIHARQLSGSLYTLDLAKCYEFLTEIHNVQKSGVFELRDFIDNKLLKVSDWLKCVTEPCSITESLALLAKWSNMPSRASYDIVSLVDGVASRPMNVEDPEDKKEILIAAQLSRIVCRALEVAAYRFLQKELNNLAKKTNENAEKFVQELGQILLTLRWRISWWQILGDGFKTRDDSRDRYVDRVNSLTRVLYFYYCNARKKLPSWTNPHSLKGIRSKYADTENPIFDDFPRFDSIDGFDEWMKHGQELIHQAGVPLRLSRY